MQFLLPVTQSLVLQADFLRPMLSVSRFAQSMRRWTAALVLGLLVVGMPAGSLFAQASSDDEQATEAAAQSAAEEPGLLIVAVQPDSPAAEAGLVRGDILLEIDGEPVNDVDGLAEVIAEIEPETAVEITWLHGSETLTAEVVLADQAGAAFLGIRPHVEHPLMVGMQRAIPGEAGALSLVPARAARWIEGELEGFVIVEVLEESPAAEAGLVPGDVVVAVGGEPLTGTQSLSLAVQALEPGDTLTLDVRKGEGETPETISITLAAQPEDEDVAFLGVRALPLHPGMEIAVTADGVEFGSVPSRLTMRLGEHPFGLEDKEMRRGGMMFGGMMFGGMMSRGFHSPMLIDPEAGGDARGSFYFERHGDMMRGDMMRGDMMRGDTGDSMLRSFATRMRMGWVVRLIDWLDTRGVYVERLPVIRFFAQPEVGIEAVEATEFEEVLPRFPLEQRLLLPDYF